MSDWRHIIGYEKHATVLKFPATSFLIAGISNYTSSTENLKVGDLLSLHFEPENTYDCNAIVIKQDANICGYVPRDMQEKVHSYVPCKVRVIDKRVINKERFGIRVDIESNDLN